MLPVVKGERETARAIVRYSVVLRRRSRCCRWSGGRSASSTWAPRSRSGSLSSRWLSRSCGDPRRRAPGGSSATRSRTSRCSSSPWPSTRSSWARASHGARARTQEQPPRPTAPGDPLVLFAGSIVVAVIYNALSLTPSSRRCEAPGRQASRLAVKDLFDTAGARHDLRIGDLPRARPGAVGDGGKAARGGRLRASSARRTCTSSPTGSRPRTSTTATSSTRSTRAGSRAARAAATRPPSRPGLCDVALGTDSARLDPHSGRVLRDRRLQAHARARAAGRRLPARAELRPRGPMARSVAECSRDHGSLRVDPTGRTPSSSREVSDRRCLDRERRAARPRARRGGRGALPPPAPGRLPAPGALLARVPARGRRRPPRPVRRASRSLRRERAHQDRALLRRHRRGGRGVAGRARGLPRAALAALGDADLLARADDGLRRAAGRHRRPRATLGRDPPDPPLQLARVAGARAAVRARRAGPARLAPARRATRCGLARPRRRRTAGRAAPPAARRASGDRRSEPRPRIRGRARRARAGRRGGRSPSSPRPGSARPRGRPPRRARSRRPARARAPTGRPSRDRSQPARSSASASGPATRSVEASATSGQRAATARRQGSVRAQAMSETAILSKSPASRSCSSPGAGHSLVSTMSRSARSTSCSSSSAPNGRLSAPAQKDRQVGHEERHDHARRCGRPPAAEPQDDHLGADLLLLAAAHEAAQVDLALDPVLGIVRAGQEQDPARGVPLGEPGERPVAASSQRSGTQAMWVITLVRSRGGWPGSVEASRRRPSSRSISRMVFSGASRNGRPGAGARRPRPGPRSRPRSWGSSAGRASTGRPSRRRSPIAPPPRRRG